MNIYYPAIFTIVKNEGKYMSYYLRTKNSKI